MVTQTCKACSKSFEATLSEVKRGNGLFCNRECSKLARTLNVVPREPNVQCGYCSIPFYKEECRLTSKSGLYFCSRAHQGLAYADPEINVWSGPKSSKPKTHPCGINNCETLTSNQHCRPCTKQFRIQQWLAGEISGSTGGRSKEPHNWVKEYLVETRGDKCEQCGWDEKAPDGRSIIQMDHIDGNYLNNRPENLQLLCPNHHAMTPNYGSLNRNSGRAHRRKGE